MNPSVAIRILLCVGCSSIFLCLPSLLKRCTKGFHLRNVQIEQLSTDFHTRVLPPSEEIHRLLLQPFFYLGRGSQSYVFQSQDETCVLKLFRTYPKESFFQRWWRPFFHRTHRNISSQEEKQYTILRATEIAFQRAPKETGLLYVHLQATTNLCPWLSLKDPIGRPHRIALDRYLFALQKKVIPIETALKQAQTTHNLERFHRQTDSFLSLLKRRTSLGVMNSDIKIKGNIGFLEEEAIEIDFANYTLQGSLHEEVARHTTALYQWLEQEAPDMIPICFNFHFEEKEKSI